MMMIKHNKDTSSSSSAVEWQKCCLWYLRTTRVRVLWELFTRQMASCREPLRGTAFTLTISSPGWSRTPAAALPSSTWTHRHTHVIPGEAPGALRLCFGGCWSFGLLSRPEHQLYCFTDIMRHPAASLAVKMTFTLQFGFVCCAIRAPASAGADSALDVQSCYYFKSL